MAKKDCSAGQKWDRLISECGPSKAEPKAKRQCSPGQRWDKLLTTCISTNTEAPAEPRPVMEQVRDTTQVDPVMVLSPALWIFVALALLGSVLVLALWFILYRRQTRLSSNSEDAEAGREPLQKTSPPSDTNGQAEMLGGAAGVPLLCPHLGPGGDGGVAVCVGPAKHAGTEASAVREHRIPLPATELGGTALVTTKTV